MSMNAPITPIDLSDGYTDLSALLKILADPAAHKAKLDELIGAEASAKERIAELHAMEADTRRLHNTAQATNIVLQRREAAVSAREAEAEEARPILASLQKRESAADAKENAVARREAAVAKREADADASFAKIKTIMDAAMRR
jgi:hypothetical protein